MFFFYCIGKLDLMMKRRDGVSCKNNYTLEVFGKNFQGMIIFAQRSFLDH